MLVTFQSRFGRAKWLEPATDASLVALAKEGVRHIAVTTPGFAADCLETLEEIALRGKESFLRHGGEKFAFLPCLNAEAEAILMYGRLMGREVSAWWSRSYGPGTCTRGRGIAMTSVEVVTGGTGRHVGVIQLSLRSQG